MRQESKYLGIGPFILGRLSATKTKTPAGEASAPAETVAPTPAFTNIEVSVPANAGATVVLRLDPGVTASDLGDIDIAEIEEDAGGYLSEAPLNKVVAQVEPGGSYRLRFVIDAEGVTVSVEDGSG